VRGFAHGVSIQARQYERHAVFGRQAEQRFIQRHIRAGRLGRAEFGRLRHGQHAPPPAQQRLALVDHNAHEPRIEVALVAQGVAPVPCAQQRLLHRVGRVRHVAGIAHGHTVQAALHSLNRLGKGLLVHVPPPFLH